MSELLPHQQRVVEEKNDLDKKMVALNRFISSGNEVFAALDFEERLLMHQQISAMSRYSRVLNERLRLWGIV